MIALLYIPVAILLGWYNAHLVNTWVDWSKGRRIKHFWNGLVHCVGCAIFWWIGGWVAGVAVFPIARISFNTSYNFFHNPRQPIDYVTPTSKSILDKLEQWCFGKDGITPLIIYFFITIVLLSIK